MGLAPDLVIRFVGDTKEFNAKLKESQHKLSEFGKSSDDSGSKLKSLGKVAAIGLGGIAAGALAVGASSVEMASEFQGAHAKLVVALKNTNSSWGAQKEAIEKAEAASRKLGFTDTDVESALASMTLGMGSSSKALANLKLAQDLSAFSGKDLATSAIAITKASEGQLRPLKQLGIDLPVAAGGAVKVAAAQKKLKTDLLAYSVVEAKFHAGLLKTPAQLDSVSKALAKVHGDQDKLNTVQAAGGSILDALSQKLKGSASAAADTLAGKQRALHAELDHVMVEIGQKLIPILLDLANWIVKTVIPAIQKLVLWVQQNWPKLIAAIKPTLDKIVGYVQGFITTVQSAWMTFGGNIKTFIHDQWIAIQNVFQGAFQTIQGLVDLFRDIFTGKWGKIWGDIVSIVLGVWKLVKGAVQGGISEVALVFGGAVSALGNIAIDIANAILYPFRAVFNAIADLWNSTIGGFHLHIPGFLGFGGVDFTIPTMGHVGAIPQIGANPATLKGNTHGGGGNFGRKAAGGPVAAGGTYLVGEKGPEMLVMGRTSGTVIPNGGGAAIHISVAINNPIGTGPTLVSEITRALRTGTSALDIKRALGIPA